jgi:hypothetical protein
LGKLSVFWKLIIGEIITLSVLWKCGQRLFKELIIYRAWVSMGAKGAWYPLNFWTVMTGTRWFWQFYYMMLCCTLEFWVIGIHCFKFLTQALCAKRLIKQGCKVSAPGHFWGYVNAQNFKNGAFKTNIFKYFPYIFFGRAFYIKRVLKI